MDVNSSVVSVGGDNFRVGGQTVDFETLIMSVQTERANLLESQLADQAKAIQDRNALIAQANDMLARAQQLKNQAAQNNNATDGGADMKAFFDQNGIKYDTTGNDMINNKDEWDVAIQGLKNFTDKLNSNSQMDMIRLQSLMNKRDQAFEMMTNVLQKTSKLNGDIISNMR